MTYPDDSGGVEHSDGDPARPSPSATMTIFRGKRYR